MLADYESYSPSPRETTFLPPDKLCRHSRRSEKNANSRWWQHYEQTTPYQKVSLPIGLRLSTRQEMMVQVGQRPCNLG